MGVGGIGGGPGDPGNGVGGPGDAAAGADPSSSGDPTSGGFGGTPAGGSVGEGGAVGDPTSGYQGYDVDFGFESMGDQLAAAMASDEVGLLAGLGDVTGVSLGGLTGDFNNVTPNLVTAAIGALLGIPMGIQGVVAGATSGFSAGDVFSESATPSEVIGGMLGVPFGFGMMGQLSDALASIEGFDFGDEVSKSTSQSAANVADAPVADLSDHTDYGLRARIPYMGDFASQMAEPPKREKEEIEAGSELASPIEGTMTSKLESPSDFFSTAKFFQQEEEQENELW